MVSALIRARRSAKPVKLAFLGDALKCLALILDPVLVLVAIRGKKFYNLESFARADPAEWPGDIANRLADRVFMDLQHTTLHCPHAGYARKFKDRAEFPFIL